MKNCREYDFVAFDTETTGKYPIESEICEIGAVKWRDGAIVDRFQALIKPTRPMGQAVIAIHGITNEMVADAEPIEPVVRRFYEFIKDAILIAHHAPFDLGFVAVELDRLHLPLPELPVVCSSLLSRKVFPESGNHRLQTLIKFFGLPQGQAHRASDDAEACLQVALRCLARLDERGRTGTNASVSSDLAAVSLDEVMLAQGGALTWSRFSLRAFAGNSFVQNFLRACQMGAKAQLSYGGGSTPGDLRIVHPIGIVPSLDGDFVVAYCERDQAVKRYLIEKLLKVEVLA